MPNTNSVGIDDIAIYVPQLYFDMRDFAELRGMQFSKLHDGLGLSAMAIPDVHEDTATMGANAAARLIDNNKIDPSTIGRIYLGTESALDAAKPTATYIMDMLEQKYCAQYGADCFRQCDVVDLTFACIGAVDAMHNTLDWVARGGVEADRIGIVIFADNAKYELGSSGEYTQGAGGGALLIKHKPRLLTVPDLWGICTTPKHDFFKPRREILVRSMVESVLAHGEVSGAQLADALVDKVLQSLASADQYGELIFGSETLAVHKDTPVFDGQFSNRCYATAVTQAFADFVAQAIRTGRYQPGQDEILSQQWARIVVHLPYAFQGKRMLPDVFAFDRKSQPWWREWLLEIGAEPQRQDFAYAAAGEDEYAKALDQYRKRISSTQQFRVFVQQKIEKSQRASSLVGNQYTGSIFLALMSTLESDYLENSDLTGRTIGFCAYGSGAKAKVFEGEVQSGWRNIASRFQLFPRLAQRRAISAATYEALHRGSRRRSVIPAAQEFALLGMGERGGLEGQRRYGWID